MENKSVFEMILSGEIDSDIIYEDEILETGGGILNAIKAGKVGQNKLPFFVINGDSYWIEKQPGSMFVCAKNLAKEFDIDQTGYRLLFNTNADAMQTVFQIHLHLIGGEKLKNI